MLLRRHKKQPVQKKTEIAEVEIPQAEIPHDEISEKHFTKTDIYRMNKDTLIQEANEVSIEGAKEMSGNTLKDKLIEYYGL